jgi:hypothetical protein
MRRLAPSRAAPVLALVALAAAAPLAAQSVRVRSTTTVRYVQLRPILYDAAAAAYEPQAVQAATPFTQDFEVNAWGFGTDGLRAYGLLRFRGSLGSSLVWPRYGDHFDALAFYLEYAHANYKLRLGRQQKASSLGWYGYDGLSAAWRPVSRLRVEGYAGRGLARGYLEPFNSSALAALDPYRPDHGTYLLGTSVSASTATSAITAIYQREVLTDRSGIVSERVAVDGNLALGALALAGTSEFDLATNDWGKARGAATLRFGQKLSVRGEIFRYVPTIDLTTIWGIFGPESHWGYGGTVQLTPWRGVALYGTYTERKYQPAAAGSLFGTDLPDREREVAAGGRIGIGAVQLSGAYRLQLDYGGWQKGGDAAITIAPAAGWRLGVKGSAFQRDGEFRVSNGTVFGTGVEARFRFVDRFDIRADVMRFMQRKQERLPAATGLDWNQSRATLSVDWTFGTNPDRQGGTR